MSSNSHDRDPDLTLVADAARSHPLTVVAVDPPHAVEPGGVEEIAAVCRFTPAEVGEYYIRVNRDAERTRRRFEKARKLLDEMSDME